MNSHFDLIVVGGGSGGISAARRAASYGAQVALIEKDRFGGTCVIRGCVPKKLLMYASQFQDTFDLANAFGWTTGATSFDMSKWQDAKSAELDRLEAIYRSMLDEAQVQVFHGTAEVIGPKNVRVGDIELACERLLIATGGRPATISIPGLQFAGTSDDILDLRSVPKRLAVVGAGYIGIEFASMFARLGSEVSVFYRDTHPLRGFDDDLRVRLADALTLAGIRLYPGILPENIVRRGEGYILSASGREAENFDFVLNATGRLPNALHLGLQKIGIDLTAVGAIPVNNYSETAVPGVFAVGDVTNRVNLTPVAIAEGRAFADTVYGAIDTPVSHDQVCSAVFTDPSIGTVGLTERQAVGQRAVHIFETSFRPMHTAFAQRNDRAYIKLVVDAQNDRVLGIHMLGPDAPEIVQSLAVALRTGATKRQFDQTVAVHPTIAEEFVLMRKPARTFGGQSQD